MAYEIDPALCQPIRNGIPRKWIARRGISLEKIAGTMGEETMVSTSLGKRANRKSEVLL